ncbi:MAG: iron ABC transporter permease [Spirochaetaceae bacterium]|jgi:iron complex transport system permease protein|nr:iron ABC transporter permease [Spirochaetaceae bacterium]
MNNALAAYKQNRKKSFFCMILLGALLPTVLIASVSLGAMPISPEQTARIVAGKITGFARWYAEIPRSAVAVVWELRLPRLLCGAFAGAGLAAAGAIFQGILQNPLADPYTLGVSTGAAFGASLAILLNLSLGARLPVPLIALCFAGLTLILALIISRRASGLTSANLIMAGIILSAMLSAGISFMKMLSGEQVAAIVFWLMGSLSARGWSEVLLLGPAILLAAPPAIVFAEDLNLLTLGARNAESLGVSVKKTRFFFLLLGAAITAVCVSVCGVIGFVGLVVPHLLRFSVTSDNRVLLPLSMLLGAVLLVSADTCARLLSGGEIPVGALTTLLGGPFFIYIFIRRRGIRE